MGTDKQPCLRHPEPSCGQPRVMIIAMTVTIERVSTGGHDRLPSIDGVNKAVPDGQQHDHDCAMTASHVGLFFRAIHSITG